MFCFAQYILHKSYRLLLQSERVPDLHLAVKYTGVVELKEFTGEFLFVLFEAAAV